jgi:hypothetical protein
MEESISVLCDATVVATTEETGEIGLEYETEVA